MLLHLATWLKGLSICGLLALTSAEDELLEYMCADVKACAAFQQPGVVVNCVEYMCECAKTTGEKIDCKAKEQKRSNVVGGSCPCTIPNGACNVEHDICQCAKDYVPSKDTRRCVHNTALLGNACELDSQCKATDPFGICQQGRCECSQNFTEINGKCASHVAANTNCTTDTDCHQQIQQSRCQLDQHICTCAEGFIFSNETETCIRKAKYEKACRFDIQCQATMGTGGFCCRGVRVCLCSRMHYPFTPQGINGTSTTICKPVPVSGEYCVKDEDCHKPTVPPANQTMDCFFGVCNCKHGYISLNDGECSSYGHRLQAQWICIVLAYFLLLLQRF